MNQYIVTRTDLKMRRGKEIAQACHGEMLFMHKYEQHPDVQTWLKRESYPKISIGIESEKDLLLLCDEADGAGIPYVKVWDEGRTEFNGVRTLTCAVIGPCSGGDVIGLCSGLKLR